MGETQLKLHDIKPLVEIQDYSFYYFLILSFLAVALLGGVFYLLLRYFKHRKKENKRKKYLQLLHGVDLYSDPKKAAYLLTKYGAMFKNDDERHKEMYENMVSKLQDYKYKKEVEPFDADTIAVINLYREICDV